MAEPELALKGFEAGSVPAIVSRPGAAQGLPQVIGNHLSGNWLLLTDATLRAQPAVAVLEAALREAAAVEVHTCPAGEPTLEGVEAAVRTVRENRVAGVVAVGGGAVMDLAKLAAAAAPLGVPVEECLLGRKRLDHTAVFRVMVPTTAGTGSEATRTAIVSNEKGEKLWAWGEALSAQLIVHDPQLTTTLPRVLAGATGVDALVHALEAWSGGRASPVIDCFASAAVRLVTRHLPRVLAQTGPSDLEAHSGMLLAATYAGVAIDNGGTGVAHAIGHALASVGKIHHGRAVGLGLGATLEWNVGRAPERFAAAAKHLGLPVEQLPQWFAVVLETAAIGRALDWPLDAGAFEAQLRAPHNQPMMRNNATPLESGEAPLVRELFERWLR